MKKVYFAIGDDLNRGYINPFLKEPDIKKEFMHEYVAITEINGKPILITRNESSFVATDIEYDYDENGFHFYYDYFKTQEYKFNNNKLNDKTEGINEYNKLINSDVSLLEDTFLLSFDKEENDERIVLYRVTDNNFKKMRGSNKEAFESFEDFYYQVTNNIKK